MQETGNSDASLSREEIQAVIDKANAQTKDAIASELTTLYPHSVSPIAGH